MKPILCLLFATGCVVSVNAQEFQMLDPSGQVVARAEVAPGRLDVLEQSGQRLYFSREQRYDSVDGQFLGYFNYEFNRVLRFPKTGSGHMQTAALNDPAPRFQQTSRVVRPIGRGGYGVAVGPRLSRPIWSGGVIAGYAPPAGFGGFYPGPVYTMPLIARPQSVLIDSRIVANPPLPPAEMQLYNDGRREVEVGVFDAENPGDPLSVRIRPGRSETVELERDSGAQRMSRYRIVTPYGETIIKQIVTAVPPQVRYELVVHEWAMQSIAIDRTGKSPNAIEDVNFQGRGLGRFVLPAGPALRSGTIDVVSTALAQGNAGSVAPIFPPDSEFDSASALEQAAFEAQQRALGR